MKWLRSLIDMRSSAEFEARLHAQARYLNIPGQELFQMIVDLNEMAKQAEIDAELEGMVGDMHLVGGDGGSG